MKYPFEIPANSFITTYETDGYPWLIDQRIRNVDVGWQNIDTGEVVKMTYQNDITDIILRMFAHIMFQQHEAMKLDEPERQDALREMARERAN